MRHGVNLAAHLQFKTSPKSCEQANKAANEHIKRASQILAKRRKASIDDPTKVKALCKQFVAVYARTVGSPYNVINYRRQMFARWAHFGAHCVFLLQTHLKLAVLFVGNYAMLNLIFNIILIWEKLNL